MTTATKTAGGWRLDGSKSVVVHGDSADRLIVSARVSGDRHDPDGIGLFLVDRRQMAWRGELPNARCMAAPTSRSPGSMSPPRRAGRAGAGLTTIERMNQAGIMATCAEAVGAMETMLALTSNI